MKRSAGFGLVAAFTVILVAGAAGGAGWYVWQQNQQAKISNSPQKTTSEYMDTKNDASEDIFYVEIKEWGIKFEYPEPENFEYRAISEETIVIGNKRLTEVDSNCSVENMGHNGIIRSATGVFGSGDAATRFEDIVKAKIKANDNYYYVSAPVHAPCTQEETSDIKIDMNKIIGTIEKI